jgi:two-component system probable response regulator PhcQ
MVQRERDFLLKEKLSALQRMMVTDRVLSLGIVAAWLGRRVRHSLVAARSFLDLMPDGLLEQTADVEEARNPNYWNNLYAHAQSQLRRIVGLLIDHAGPTQKDGGSRVEPVDVKAAVAKVVDKLNGGLMQHGLTAVNRIPTELPPIMVEAESLHRLLELLLQDEIIALSSGNQIIFGARHLSGKEDAVEIEVKDNGPGLPPDALRAVFDPYFARADKYQELGINLMACYFIAYHLEGKIGVRSEPGQGVTFTLTFPTQSKPESPVAAEEEAFLNRVLVNDAFWERLVTAQN